MNAIQEAQFTSMINAGQREHEGAKARLSISLAQLEAVRSNRRNAKSQDLWILELQNCLDDVAAEAFKAGLSHLGLLAQRLALAREQHSGIIDSYVNHARNLYGADLDAPFSWSEPLKVYARKVAAEQLKGLPADVCASFRLPYPEAGQYHAL
jgi:hypothetical protein